MARLRLAHFSDIHYSTSPLDAFRESVRGKRLANCFSYYLGGRRERFADAADRIARLLDDVDAMSVDHAICTGDLTASTLDAELDGVAGLFGPRLAMPERFTVVPGNHDRYVADAAASRAFERRFGALCPLDDRGFPVEKRIAKGVRVLAIDTARPTSFVDSSGLCGAARREAVAAALAADATAPTIVAMHYGLLRWQSNPDRERHGLRDHLEVASMLEASPARIALVLHGHMHGAFTVPIGERTAICAGSATDLLVDCGYFIYEIDLETLEVSVERRHWNRESHRFESLGCADLESAIRERRGARLPHQRPLT